MHGYLEPTCLLDSLTRESENEVNLTLIRYWLSSTHNAYIGNGLHIVLRLFYGEISKITYKTQSFFLKEIN
jgi:hypothetical protein